MSHQPIGLPVDIERASEGDRKITFDHYEDGRFYYDTAFGEQFFIHYWMIGPNGMKRIEKAVDWCWAMHHYNDYHTEVS